MVMFPSGYVFHSRTHIRTHLHALFVFPLLLFFSTVHCVGTTVSLIQQSWEELTGMFQSKWHLIVNWSVFIFYVAIIWRCTEVWGKLSYGFWQEVDFLGDQTGSCMGDTGESNNTPVKVHLNQIPLHELNLNAGYNPNTLAAIYWIKALQRRLSRQRRWVCTCWVHLSPSPLCFRWQWP